MIRFRKGLCLLLALMLSAAMLVACKTADPAPTVRRYTVTVNESPDFTVTGLLSGGYVHGDDVLFSVRVTNAEKEIASVSSPDVAVRDDGNGVYGFEMPRKSVSVAVVLKEKGATLERYAVTINESSDFTVTGLSADGYTAGENVFFTVTVVAAEKEIASVSSPDVTVADKGDGAYGFEMPQKPVSVMVVLKDEGPAAESKLTLMMTGALYAGEIRSVYAKTDYIGALNWASSDTSVIEIISEKTLQGEMPETILRGKQAGTATITCVAPGDATVAGSLSVEVRSKTDGVEIDPAVYAKLTGSLKVSTVEKLCSYDKTYAETVDEQNTVETIYQELADESSDTIEGNYTDAFHISAARRDGTVTFERTLISDGSRVCAEYVDLNNEVHLKTVLHTDTDGESGTIKWRASAYFNPFQYAGFSEPSDWKSTDGGATYRYVGGDLGATNLCYFLYQKSDISPDDMYLTVNGDEIRLVIAIDPAGYNNLEKKKYGSKIESVFSEYGTAQVPRMRPYAHESYHDALGEAIAAMAGSKQYKATLSIENTVYEITYLEDTIDVVVKENNVVTEHTGAHKYAEASNGNTYYEYKVDDTGLYKIKDHNTPWEGDGVARYPDFAFSAEIFEQSALDANTYGSRSANGAFVKKTCYMPGNIGYYGFGNDGTLTLDAQGHIVSVATDVTENGGSEPIELRIVFSEFGTASLDLDFGSVQEPVAPVTWEAGAPQLCAKMSRCGMPVEILPYIEPGVGWDTSVYPLNLGGGVSVEHAAIVETGNFTDDGTRDAYVEAYKAALVAAGWVLTEETCDKYGYDLYEKDGYRVAVGPELDWNDRPDKSVRIIVYGETVDPDGDDL